VDQNARGGPEDTGGAELDPAKSNTQKTQHHETCGFGYVVVRCDGHTEAPVVYHGPGATTRFLEHLGREEINQEQMSPVNPSTHGNDTRRRHSPRDCPGLSRVCETPRRGQRERPLPHHGKVQVCRSQCLQPETHILLVFHTPRGYDSHLIMQAISQEEGQINCIPNNMEKYISFSLRSLIPPSSCRPLSTSWSALAQTKPSPSHGPFRQCLWQNDGEPQERGWTLIW
jgi:hypothetical protein